MGFHRLLSVDFSQVLIEKMTARYPHLEFACCDCTTMEGHDDSSFDAIIDKGLLVRVLAFI